VIKQTKNLNGEFKWVASETLSMPENLNLYQMGSKSIRACHRIRIIVFVVGVEREAKPVLW
jgi:hypothetical protein